MFGTQFVANTRTHMPTNTKQKRHFLYDRALKSVVINTLPLYINTLLSVIQLLLASLHQYSSSTIYFNRAKQRAHLLCVCVCVRTSVFLYFLRTEYQITPTSKVRTFNGKCGQNYSTGVCKKFLKKG